MAGGKGRGRAGGCKAPTRNLQNIKHKRADQPGNKRVIPYRIHVMSLLNRRSWKKLIVKNVCICTMFCAVLCGAVCDMSVDFVVLTKAHFYAYVCRGPGSSVGIANDYGLDGPGSNAGGDEIFRQSRPALGPTQPPVKWAPGLSLG